jgi:MinD-like ATPase involved in chromosome partitioning or flagellar assembly
VDYFGHIEWDLHVPKAVRTQTVVTQRYPDAAASRCFRELAHRMVLRETPDGSTERLVWEKLLNDWVN